MMTWGRCPVTMRNSVCSRMPATASARSKMISRPGLQTYEHIFRTNRGRSMRPEIYFAESPKFRTENLANKIVTSLNSNRGISGASLWVIRGRSYDLTCNLRAPTHFSSAVFSNYPYHLSPKCRLSRWKWKVWSTKADLSLFPLARSARAQHSSRKWTDLWRKVIKNIRMNL